MNNECSTLTKYKSASILELWNIAYPLMLTALSGNLMLFMDKLLLSRYLPVAMTAATTVGMIFTIFQLASISIASIAEVFVGKYNGSGENTKIGPVVWQMIWFSLLSTIIFIPLGTICGSYFLPNEYYNYGLPYFRTIMMFGPFFPLVSALSAFFIGRGKIKLITILTILTNLINIILAYIFIFGFEPFLPSLGVVGAALATGIAILLQALILFIYFLKKTNRVLYFTGNYFFKASEFFNCLKIGLPNSLSYLMEMAAWACLLQMMIHKDSTHIMMLSIGQAVFLLIAFTTDGLQKAVISVSSNLIGANKANLLPRVIKSGLSIQAILVIIFSIPLLIFPDFIIHLFFSTDSSYSYSVTKYAQVTCVWILAYFVFDGIVWIFAGMLTALEDTFSIMLMNIISVWMLAILPNYIAIEFFNSEASIIWKLMAIYAFVNSIEFILRYRYKSNNFLKTVTT